MKSYQKTVVGDTKSLVGSLKYLVNFEKYLNWTCPTEKSKFRSVDTYLDMLCSCVIKLVQKSATKLQGAMGDGMSPMDAFDKVAALTIVDAAKLHTVLFSLKFFNKTVESLAEGSNKIAMQNMALMFAVDNVQTFATQLIDTKSINQQAMEHVKDLYTQLLDDLHPDALTLCEVWGIQDSELMSTIGHSNGKPYENLLENAKTFGMLNKFDVHPAMLEYMKARNGENIAATPSPKM